ncbi:MAG: GAF domain-containing protein [Elusimicrobiota bacterium]
MIRAEDLYDALDFFYSLREPDEFQTWSRILEKIAAVLRAEGAAYLYFDPKNKRLVPFHALGPTPDPDSQERMPVSVGEGLLGWVAKFREPLMVAQAGADKRFRKDIDTVPGLEPHGALCVPVFDRLDLTGVLAFFNKEEGSPFSDADLRFTLAVSRLSSMALRRLRLEGMVNRVTSYNSSILDNLSGGFLAVDLQGRVMICNPAARRILGIQGDVTDLPIENAVPHLMELAAILRMTLASKQTVKRRDLRWNLGGEARLLGYSSLLIQDAAGAFTGAGITFQDITKPGAPA